MAMATLAVAFFALYACSVGGGRFKVEARLLNMNQAKFYAYSPDGAINGIDTIEVNGGRFSYTHDIQREGTLVLVFPNFTTMPIFVEPGASIDIDGNAAKLREMKITGTEVNEQFTEWRANTQGLSPVDMKKQAEHFINDHPASPAARWLLRQYYIECAKPDINGAKVLVKKMLQASDNNINVAKLSTAINSMGNLNVGDGVPNFTAKTIDGDTVSAEKLRKGRTVVCIWASWNNDSQNMLRQVASHQENGTDSLKFANVLTICLDPSVALCRQTLKQCGAEKLKTICDTMIWNSPMVKTFDITTIPDNIRFKDGKATDRHIPSYDLTKK